MPTVHAGTIKARDNSSSGNLRTTPTISISLAFVLVLGRVLPIKIANHYSSRSDELRRALTLAAALRPWFSEYMEAWDVSPIVNGHRNDTPQCIRRLPAAFLNYFLGVTV